MQPRDYGPFPYVPINDRPRLAPGPTMRAGLDRALGYIRAHDGVWFATGEEIVCHWPQSGATF